MSSIERLPRGARERESEREGGAKRTRTERGRSDVAAKKEAHGVKRAAVGRRSEGEGKKRGIERDRAEQGRSRRLFVPPPPPPPDKNRPRSCVPPSSQNGTRLCVHGVPGVP